MANGRPDTRGGLDAARRSINLEKHAEMGIRATAQDTPRHRVALRLVSDSALSNLGGEIAFRLRRWATTRPLLTTILYSIVFFGNDDAATRFVAAVWRTAVALYARRRMQMSAKCSVERLSRMVEPARVHRQIYTDPDIFELEMSRIFATAWVYVGHESQIKHTGDYFCTRVARKPLVIVRGADGEVRALHNQCAHRGAMVVANDAGCTNEFQCCYHGWTYHLDGRLKALPLNHGYPDDFDPKSPRTAMVQVPRLKSYRGFIFVSLAAQGQSFEQFIGYMKTSLDDMIDRAPDGEIEVAGGTFKHVYEGNWKLYLENLCDAAHPWFTHRSSIAAAQDQKDDVYSDGTGEIAIRQMRQNGAPYSFWESQVGIWTYPNGHSYLGDYHDDAKLVAAMNDPIFREYFAALEVKKGKEETQRIMEVRRWNSNIYPNLSMMSQFQQLRVIQPISVNRTVVHTYCFKLRGAPTQMFRNTISFANVVNGTGSLVLTDDLEIYNRITLGLASEGAEWLEIGRGYQTDRPDAHGGRKGKNSTSEIYIRNMFDAWRGYMLNGAFDVEEEAVA